MKKYANKQFELKQISEHISLLIEKEDKLSKDLIALGTVLKMHEIPIEPEFIPSRRKNKKLHGLKHGAITKSIYKCLKASTENAPLNITQIFLFIVIDLNLDLKDDMEAHKLRLSIRKRLKDLALKNKINRVFTGNKCKESTYLKKP